MLFDVVMNIQEGSFSNFSFVSTEVLFFIKPTDSEYIDFIIPEPGCFNYEVNIFFRLNVFHLNIGYPGYLTDNVFAVFSQISIFVMPFSGFNATENYSCRTILYDAT